MTENLKKHGLALLWKERGIKSQSFLGEFKKSLGYQKKFREGIGHTGTLDPFAEGLLLVGLGEATKLLTPLSGLSKCYEVRMLLGISSESFDDSGPIFVSQPESIFEIPWSEAIQNPDILGSYFKNFLDSKKGVFEQIPPQHSAVHVDGKRSYEWAREGISKELKSRTAVVESVEHRSIKKTNYLNEHLVLEWNFKVQVSSGTYIRSFARDWAKEICHCSGLLSRLVRTQIGPLSFLPESQDATLNNWHKWLYLNDLTSLFSTKILEHDQAEKLKKFGNWKAERFSKMTLLLNPHNELIAWVPARSSSVGRVFCTHPL